MRIQNTNSRPMSEAESTGLVDGLTLKTGSKKERKKSIVNVRFHL